MCEVDFIEGRECLDNRSSLTHPPSLPLPDAIPSSLDLFASPTTVTLIDQHLDRRQEAPTMVVMSSVIPKGSTVLVTGVNGYIASHVADKLLAAGFKVRGTVRSLHKADWVFERFDTLYGKGRFSCVEVPDMVADGAFDEAVKDMYGICHLASIVSFSDKPEEVIPQTIRGAINILTSARKEPSVKSVVFTSSSVAAQTPPPDVEMTITKDTWNDAAVKAAWGPDANPFDVYAASKTEAEQAFWKNVHATSPSFQVTSVMPGATFGEITQPGGQDTSSTASWLNALWKGDSSFVFQISPFWYVNVNDVAELHVAALIDSSVNGQRIFCSAAPFLWNEALALFRKENPERQFPEDKKGEGRDASHIPNEEAEDLLRRHYGHGWTGLEETLRQNTAILKI
jgi:nucleoside-diphosphate-sugar epimerase